MKVYHSIVAIFVIALIAVLSGCSSYSNYTEISGYKDYISDNNTGYGDVEFYDCTDALETNESAREFFNKNKRQEGDYIITDYMDGVCINRYVGANLAEDATLSVPESIGGKPVVKIGCYIKDNGDDCLGAFSGNRDFILKLPSTVKYIGSRTFLFYSGIIPEKDRRDFTFVKSIEVSDNNPYYASYNGALFTKDKKKLLYDPKLEWIYPSSIPYEVPDFVEAFEPSNGVSGDKDKIKIGDNVKTINTFIDKGENGIEPNPELIPNVVICGYKGSEAERWAKEQYAKFEVISE